MPYVTLKNGNRIEALDEFTGESKALEFDTENKKVLVDYGDGSAPEAIGGMTPEQSEELDQAVDDIAQLKIDVARAETKADIAGEVANSKLDNSMHSHTEGTVPVANENGQLVDNFITNDNIATNAGIESSKLAFTSAQTSVLNSGIDATKVGQIQTNADNISLVDAKATRADGEATRIGGLIPSEATTSNQLADKNFVNSTVGTNTANFIGTFNSLADLEAYSGTVTNNDYAFVIGTDSAGNTVYKRYKYTDATTPASWVFEYDLNNSSFTAAQWATINSGATASTVSQVGANTSAIANLATVATTGDYTDLSNKPTIPVVDQTYDGTSTNAQSGVAIAGAGFASASDLATVATSGDYNDLSNKPTIPAAPVWGNIRGTLSYQSDLDAVLNNKVDYSQLSSYLQNLASHPNALSIGSSSSENGVVSLGLFQNNLAVSSTVIGNYANSNSDNGIALGSGAEIGASASFAIQLGKGINKEPSTLYVGGIANYTDVNYKLLDLADGLIPDARLSSNIARAADIPVVDQSYSSASTNAQSGAAIAGAGFLTNKGTLSYNLAIGEDAVADNSYSVALGGFASATADGAIQLGMGTNSTAYTFKVNRYELLNTATGLIPDGRISGNIARASSIPTVDQTYDSTSANAQSGVAVAQAVAAAGSSKSDCFVRTLTYQLSNWTNTTDAGLSATYPKQASNTIELLSVPYKASNKVSAYVSFSGVDAISGKYAPVATVTSVNTNPNQGAQITIYATETPSTQSTIDVTVFVEYGA